MIDIFGKGFDLQNGLNRIPGFIFSKYSPEKHYPGYNYLGPSTRLDMRLDENDLPREGEEAINQTDALAYQHDLDYRDATSLDDKISADKRMLELLKQVEISGASEKLANFIAQKILSAKIKLGVGLSEESAIATTKELYKEKRTTNSGRMIIVTQMNDTHAIDLADTNPVIGKNHHRFKFILVCIDIFTRFGYFIPMTSKSIESIKSALLEIWKTGDIPKKIFADRESALRSKEITKLLKDNNVELYHSEGFGKSVIAERAIGFMKESLAKLQTKEELEGQD